MLTDLIDHARNFLFARQHAYRMTFSPESVHAQKVLRDLARFCRAHKTTFHTDDRVQVMLEGRKEVWLRIQTHLNLTDDELWNLHKGDQINE